MKNWFLNLMADVTMLHILVEKVASVRRKAGLLICEFKPKLICTVFFIFFLMLSFVTVLPANAVLFLFLF